jgi:hypothetical protein
MLPNEEFALACLRYYGEQGLIVDKTNGEFAHCPYPEGLGESGYYLLHEHHQQQGLLQSRDLDRKCFWGGDVKRWLTTCDYWPDNFFELWDIYDYFMQQVSHLHTPAVRSKIGESCKKFQLSRSEDERKANMQIAKNSLSWNPGGYKRKPVEILFPDGRVGRYPSQTLAYRAIGMGSHTIADMLKNGKIILKGKFKGYSARYL